MTAAALRPVSIKIDEDTKVRVKRLADARHRTPHWLMREAINQYLEREEKLANIGQLEIRVEAFIEMVEKEG